MTVERLAEHLNNELASVPTATGSLKTVRRRARRRRLVRGIASAATTLVVVLVAVSLLLPGIPRIAAADGPDTPTRLLIDGELEIPITDEPVAEVDNNARSLTVYGGLAAPDPEFDISTLGEEQPLIQNRPAWGTTDPGSVPVVYLGDVAGHPAFIHTNDPLGLIERLLFELTHDGTIGPHLCLTVGDRATVGGGGLCTGPGTTLDQRSASGPLHHTDDGYVGSYVAWMGLPSESTVVRLELEDGTRLWQKPYGETSVFIFDEPDTSIATLKAFDSQGTALSDSRVAIVRGR